jgi:annexin A7/11
MPGYGQQPSQTPYQQAAQPSYPSLPNAFPQSAPNYSSPQHQQSIQVQQQHIQVQQYATSYSSSPAAHVGRGRPSVLPAPNFDPSNDAAALRKAMKGFGTDEDGLINILCRRPSYQRVEIVRAYKTAYGKDLFEDIRSESSGNFQSVLIALLMPKAEYYCRELYEAMVGAGTDEDPLIEVMCTMSNQEIREIGMMYQRMFGQTLESHLRSDTSGNMKRLMTSLSTGNRDESMRTDINSARQDAESLKRAGIARFGTDESEFNRILCLRNYEQLKLVCQEYEKLTGNPLEKDIKREFSGDIEDALLSIIRVANNRPEFFARRLHKSMAGLGTTDRSLIRLCVTRSEVDMEDIKQEFQRYYGKSLKSFIKGDTSGHYKHALYALCGENRS